MGFFDNFKNSPVNPFYMWERDDPEKEANKYLGQIPGVEHQYYDPFVQSGQEAGGMLKGQYGSMLNDPTGFINKILAQYKQSPGAQYQTGLVAKGIGNTAAAGGFAGTPEAQRQYAQSASDISSQDMQQFLQNALGVYGTGLSGEQDIYGKGFTASGSLADALASVLGSQGGLAFKAGSDRNADRQALLNAVMKALANKTGVTAGTADTAGGA
jgi:hypothetical protein